MFVRTAGARDIDAIVAASTEAFRDSYDALYGDARSVEISGRLLSKASLTAWLTRPNAEFLVADDGKEIGGCAVAAASDDGKLVSLHHLYVRPAHQGHGIGGALLDEVTDSFADADLIRVEVEAANIRAVSFFQSYGFVETGRIASFRFDQSGIEALVLEKPLL